MNPRYQLGEEAEFSFQVRDANDEPSWPDAAPVLRIYTSVGIVRTLFELVRVPPADRQNVTGWFATSVLLDAETNVNVPDWIVSTPYVIGDAVKYGGTVYRCILAHTSSGLTLPDDPFSTHWALYDLVSQFEEYIQGQYWWRASWAVDGVAGVESGYFEIVGGGEASGPILSMEFIDRRGSTHLLQHAAEQEYLMGRNPRI